MVSNGPPVADWNTSSIWIVPGRNRPSDFRTWSATSNRLLPLTESPRNELFQPLKEPFEVHAPCVLATQSAQRARATAGGSINNAICWPHRVSPGLTRTLFIFDDSVSPIRPFPTAMTRPPT